MKDRQARTGFFSRLALPGGLLCVALSLSSCTELYTGKPAEAPPCPQVSKLTDAAELTRFVDGPGRDLIDVDFNAQIWHLSGKCFYEWDSDTGEGVVRMEVKTEFKIDRGPANTSREAHFDYFVSLLDDKGTILQKPLFAYQAKYWKNRMSIRDIDSPVELTIPIASDQSGDNFKIYVGFQLTREELEYNRVIMGR